MKFETDDMPEAWEQIEDHYHAYEVFVIGATDEEPSMDSLTPQDYELALEARAFLDWKYQEGLCKAEYRTYDPGFLRSSARIAYLGMLPEQLERAI